MRNVLRWIGTGLAMIAALLAAGWTALALTVQLAPPMRWIWLAILALTTIAVLVLLARRPRFGIGLFAIAAVVMGVWWSTIRPSDSRDWAPDVAHGVTGEINGSHVTLHNVRAFDWRSDTDYTPRWETREVDLDKLAAVDLVSSVWDNPAIAHTLVSFDFGDGGHVVFSAEIRREKGEAFSALGGFVRQFELILLAAEESDILRLRTNIRREDVSLYRLKMPPEEARKLFLAYVEKGNGLAAHPQFYNTVTTNCTTVIFDLARAIDPGVPVDWRVLVSGYLPDYLYDHRAIRTDAPLATVRQEARISARAQAAAPDIPYSQAIRTP